MYKKNPKNLFVFVVWFFFFRIDYSEPWIKEGEEEDALVVWCKNGSCGQNRARGLVPFFLYSIIDFWDFL